MIFRRNVSAALLSLLFPVLASAQGNGQLQIHYLNVGQGDGTVIISPLGEVVMIDNGVLNQCSGPINYVQSLGVTKIDYHVASHYHSDHIGCTPQTLAQFPLQQFAYDRGGSYTTQTYTRYVAAVGAKRRTAAVGGTIVLDSATAHPVTLRFVALNGNGDSTTDENDLSLVVKLSFGSFDAEFGGDLSGSGSGIVDPDPNPEPTPGPDPNTPPAGATARCNDGTWSFSQNRSGTCSHHGGVWYWVCPGLLCSSSSAQITTNSYADIESSVAALVGEIEVYKVHHHGSRYSSNATWLSVTKPKVGIISAGATNSYGHPTAEALARLHAVGTKTYWTTSGNGVAPVPGDDFVGGHVRVQVMPGTPDFAIISEGGTHWYTVWSAVPGTPTLISPGGSITLRNPLLTWHAVPGAASYYVWLDDSTGNRMKTWFTAAQAGCAAGTNTCTVYPPGLTEPNAGGFAIGPGQWWVQARNPAGLSPWSAGMNFSVDLAPFYSAFMLGGYALGPLSAGSTARLWTHVKNIGNTTFPAGTKVWFYVDGPNLSGDRWVGATDMGGLVANASKWFSFDWTVPATATAGTYAYWARPYLNGPLTDWSAGTQFSVVAAPPPSARIQALWPVNGGNLAPGASAFLWAQIVNTGSMSLPAGAKVWFYVDGPGWIGDHWVGSASVEGLVAGATNWFAFDWPVSNTAPEGTYTYWARVYSGGAISPWSAGQSFNVEAR